MLGLGMAGRARSWLGVGQAFGVLLLPGLGSAAPAPRFLGTQLPRATQALIKLFDWQIILKNTRSKYDQMFTSTTDLL